MTSPSEPVESREQPRLVDGGIQFAIALAQQDDADPKRNGYTTLNARAVIEGLTELLEGRATIRELRAECAREFEFGNEWCRRALAAETVGQQALEQIRLLDADLQGALTERDAALAEVSRLREQGEALAQQVTDLEREVYELSMGEDL